MRVNLGHLVCDGFPAHATDFGTQYNSKPFDQATIDGLETMIESAVSVESDPQGTSFCDFTFLGHSDRVDTPGLSSEDRRAQELQASTDRAASARDWMFNEITTRLLNEGYVVPADIPSLQNVTMRYVSCGAANLVNLTPGNDEQQRRANRRVEIIGVTYQPGQGPPVDP